MIRKERSAEMAVNETIDDVDTMLIAFESLLIFPEVSKFRPNFKSVLNSLAIFLQGQRRVN